MMPRDPEPVRKLDFVPVEPGSARLTARLPVAVEPPDILTVGPVSTALPEEARSGLWDD